TRNFKINLTIAETDESQPVNCQSPTPKKSPPQSDRTYWDSHIIMRSLLRFDHEPKLNSDQKPQKSLTIMANN
ncbi:hypothetical protein B9S53_22765, partial [Arthrospira sp. O9.13F]